MLEVHTYMLGGSGSSVACGLRHGVYGIRGSRYCAVVWFMGSLLFIHAS